jgi:DNA mismatch endonuclease (patch repair protein)
MPRSGTQPEIEVGRILRAFGLRARRNVRSLPGKPDFASKKLRFAVFVHGCFWHGHAGCAKATTPRSNTWWWKMKIAENRMRDRRKHRELVQLGYRVLTVWECELKNLDKVKAKIGVAVRRFL